MAIKKIRMRPEGGNDYADVLHPETSADQVKIGNTDIGFKIHSVETDLSEHQADNATIKHKAKEIGLEDTANKFTATNVETGMLELFTNVSDGKQLVGNAITGVDNSVVIPTEPSFGDLAGAIGGISTGKKWASGKVLAGGTGVTVSDLGFKPTVIIVRQYRAGNALVLQRVYCEFETQMGINNMEMEVTSGALGGVSTVTEYPPFQITNGGFNVNGLFQQGSYATWIAFE